MLAQKSNI